MRMYRIAALIWLLCLSQVALVGHAQEKEKLTPETATYDECMKSARASYEARNFKSASTWADRAVQKAVSPYDTAGALLYSARCLTGAKEFTAARQKCLNVLTYKGMPDKLRMDAMDRLADVYFQDGKFEDSRKTYRKLFDMPGVQDEDRAYFQSLLAWTYLEEKKPSVARTEFLKVKSMKNPGQENVNFAQSGVAASYYDEGDLKKAKEEFEATLKATLKAADTKAADKDEDTVAFCRMMLKKIEKKLQ